MDRFADRVHPVALFYDDDGYVELQRVRRPASPHRANAFAASLASGDVSGQPARAAVAWLLKYGLLEVAAVS